LVVRQILRWIANRALHFAMFEGGKVKVVAVGSVSTLCGRPEPT
jgi:hypothetical protein